MPQEQENWEDIHEDFGKNYWKTGKAYWINWKERGFTYQEAREWIRVGLNISEYDLATDLREANIVPQQFAKFKSRVARDAQEFIDHFCPKETRKEITYLDVSGKNLAGSLDLSSFTNLEILNCSLNQLNYLNLDSLTKLMEVRCHRNNLINISLRKCNNLILLWCSHNHLIKTSFLDDLNPKKLTELSISDNNFPEQDLSFLRNFINLEYVFLTNNRFCGSLEPLKKLSKLKRLEIFDSEIDDGVEFLANNLKEIEINDPSSVFYKKEDKLINRSLNSYKKENKENVLNFYNLQSWRQNQPAYQNLQQTLTKINPNLDVNEIVNQFEFFNVKTGEFQGDLNNLAFLFSKSQENLDFLTRKLMELTNLVKEQKNKIVSAYLHFAPEKELLQELIGTHLAYNKANLTKGEEDKETIKLWKQRRKIQKELEDKLEENPGLLIKVENVLKECNKLAEAELELANKFVLAIEFNQTTNAPTYYFVNVNQGNVLIGNQIGDQANFIIHNKLIESNQEQIAQIHQLPPNN